MTAISRFRVLLLGTVAACAWQGAAIGADLAGTIVQPDTTLPAVSGINGKWEFDPTIVSGGLGVRASGSLSVPLGDRFGIQLDGMGRWGSSGAIYGGALHAFTRDPSRYLLGVTSGVVVAPGKSTLGAVGVEAELYADRVSFEGWAGFAALNYVNPAMLDLAGLFGFADVAYYPTDNLRLALGGSYVLGKTAVHFGTEYQLTDLGSPLSVTGDARLYTTGEYSVRVGLKGYFGGDPDKSLIDRQRQDDPRERATDLFEGSGDLMFDTPAPVKHASDYTDKASCEAAGFFWWDGESVHIPVGCHDDPDPESSAAACITAGGTPVYEFETTNFEFCDLSSPQ